MDIFDSRYNSTHPTSRRASERLRVRERKRERIHFTLPVTFARRNQRVSDRRCPWKQCQYFYWSQRRVQSILAAHLVLQQPHHACCDGAVSSGDYSSVVPRNQKARRRTSVSLQRGASQDGLAVGSRGSASVSRGQRRPDYKARSAVYKAMRTITRLNSSTKNEDTSEDKGWGWMKCRNPCQRVGIHKAQEK